MTIAEFDHLETAEKAALLTKCCGSQTWVNKMLEVLPAEDLVDLLESAGEQWEACSEADWREAFTHHPKIGDVSSLRTKFADTAEWAAGEQAAVGQSTDAILQALADGNTAYEEKFGYIFIVCATGKTAAEMLTLLQQRLPNNADAEIKIAADEQNKITQLRLQKLFIV